VSALWGSTGAIDLGDPAALLAGNDDPVTASDALPETGARGGAPVDEFTAAGEPRCRGCYVRAVCEEG
jgi:hypothetical protein